MRLDDLTQSPEGHAVAVGKTAALAPGDQVRISLDGERELVHEPRLPHAGHADDRDELRLALRAGSLERVDEDVELALPSDERRPVLAIDSDA